LERARESWKEKRKLERFEKGRMRRIDNRRTEQRMKDNFLSPLISKLAPTTEATRYQRREKDVTRMRWIKKVVKERKKVDNASVEQGEKDTDRDGGGERTGDGKLETRLVGIYIRKDDPRDVWWRSTDQERDRHMRSSEERDQEDMERMWKGFVEAILQD